MSGYHPQMRAQLAPQKMQPKPPLPSRNTQWTQTVSDKNYFWKTIYVELGTSTLNSKGDFFENGTRITPKTYI